MGSFPFSSSSLHQTLKVKGVDRTPYLGDVAVVVHPGKKEMGTPLADTPTRPVTRHGGMRDLHESSFSLSGKSRATWTGTCVSTTAGWWEQADGQAGFMLLFPSSSSLPYGMAGDEC